jgi:hypothetical protein
VIVRDGKPSSSTVQGEICILIPVHDAASGRRAVAVFIAASNFCGTIAA